MTNCTFLTSAIEQLVAWKLRTRSELPLALDISELILRSILQEQMDSKEELAAWWKMENVRLIYAMALVRFVNFVDELGRRKPHNTGLRSMHRVLGQFDIPPWIVDLRHSVAHRNLPSLDVLKKAVLFCKHWLWENYWKLSYEDAATISEKFPQEESQNESKVMETIYSSLMRYETAMFKNLFDADNSDKNAVLPDLNEEEKEIKRLISRHANIFLNEFVSEGHLILNQHQLDTANIDCSGSIPESLQLFWRPVFAALEDYRLLPQLLLCLVSRLAMQKYEVTSKQQMKLWVTLIIDANCNDSTWEEEEWRDVLSKMLAAPDNYTKDLLIKAINCIPAIIKEKKDKLLQLVDLYTGTISQDSSHSKLHWHSIDELVQELGESDKVKSAHRQSATKKRWRLEKNCSWHELPLGLAPGQTADELDLNLKRKHNQSNYGENKKKKLIPTTSKQITSPKLADESLICLD